MCIIAAKAAGVDFPSDQTIENMWFKNPDGAGFMYAKGGKVHIEKGFMNYLDFLDRIDTLSDEIDLKKTAMVLHFRITTHGGTCAENCHPFPISDSIGMLKKLKLTTDIGVAHNGIIDITTPKDISDTQMYIMKQLAPLKKGAPDFLKNKHLLQMVHNAIESKMAFLDGKGNLTTIGDFIEDNGIMYSNSSYKHSDFFYRDFSWSTTNPMDEWENYEGLDGVYTHQEVMWVKEEDGEYAFDENWMPLYDAAIDTCGNVYVYHSYADALIWVPKATALDNRGKTLVFDPDSDMVTDELIFKEY